MITSDKNSLLRYAVKRSGNAVAYCALTIKAGTRYEGTYPEGIAHFIEHTLFKGTAHKSARTITGYLDKLGGELNAFTTKEEIVLHATVLKEDIDKAADLLFELATCPTFPEAEIQTEKGVVIDEINSYKDSPSEDIYDVFEQKIFEGHPLSKLILGTTDSVKSIQCSDLRAYVQEKFIPENMVFTLVADIEEEKMEKKVKRLIDKYFKSEPNIDSCLTANKCISIACDDENPCPFHRFQKTIDQENHQVNCVIGGYAPSIYDHENRIPAILMSNILGGPSNNSILNTDLREKHGWVYGVECSYNQYSDCGLITISFGCDEENLTRCLRHIDSAINKLSTTILSDAKLKAAKKQLLGQLAISYDNGENLCLSMGKNLLTYGEIDTDGKMRQKIQNVTAEEIRTAAATIFAKTNRSRLIYL